MMKSLYSEIIEVLIDSNNNTNRQVFFSYTHAIFEKSKNTELYVKSIKPILLTDDKIMDNTNSIKLIISLGYERLSAIGLIENLQIDYNDVIVLINKEEENSKHYLECLKSNSDFLSLLKADQILEVNFFDFKQVLSTIESILFNLSRNNETAIIAPMSVKSFSLMSMIISLKYKNLRFYNVTSESQKTSYDKYPDTNRDPIIYKMITKNESDRV